MNETDRMMDRVLPSFWRKFGFEGPTGHSICTPMLSYDKFRAAPRAVQKRYLRIYDAAIERLAAMDRVALHRELHPLHGSLEVYQRALLEAMRAWRQVYYDIIRG